MKPKPEVQSKQLGLCQSCLAEDTVHFKHLPGAECCPVQISKLFARGSHRVRIGHPPSENSKHRAGNTLCQLERLETSERSLLFFFHSILRGVCPLNQLLTAQQVAAPLAFPWILSIFRGRPKSGTFAPASSSWQESYHVLAALNGHKKSSNGSRVLILGVPYKRDIDDLRESSCNMKEPRSATTIRTFLSLARDANTTCR